MTITVDEALLAARNAGNCDEDCCQAELADAVVSLREQVERLRVDLTCAQASYVSARDAALAAEAKLKWFEEREPKALALVNAVNAYSYHVDLHDDASSTADELDAAIQGLADWNVNNPRPHDPDELDKHLAR